MTAPDLPGVAGAPRDVSTADVPTSGTSAETAFERHLGSPPPVPPKPPEWSAALEDPPPVPLKIPGKNAPNATPQFLRLAGTPIGPRARPTLEQAGNSQHSTPAVTSTAAFPGRTQFRTSLPSYDEAMRDQAMSGEPPRNCGKQQPADGRGRNHRRNHGRATVLPSCRREPGCEQSVRVFAAKG